MEAAFVLANMSTPDVTVTLSYEYQQNAAPTVKWTQRVERRIEAFPDEFGPRIIQLPKSTSKGTKRPSPMMQQSAPKKKAKQKKTLQDTKLTSASVCKLWRKLHIDMIPSS
jgi:hypothetical protein